VTTLHLDLETRSTVTDLGKVGAVKYAQHPDTDVWCACFAIDDGSVQSWRPGQPVPSDLADGLRDPSVTVAAHNAAFEWLMIEHILSVRYGWSKVPTDRLDCTAVRAAVQSLPRSLGEAATVLGLEVEKDMAGRRLMLQMAKPRRIEDDGAVVWWDDEERIARLVAYCKTDVEVERELDRILRPLSGQEKALWRLDFHMNNVRGVPVDKALIDRAETITQAGLTRRHQAMRRVTKGLVPKTSNNAKLVSWLRSQGVDTESVDKNNIDRLLKAEDVPESAREALLIRREAAKSSTSKLAAFRARLMDTSEGPRVFESLLHHGAGTGRWSGKGVQLQNLPRPSRPQEQVDQIIELLTSDLSDQAVLDAIEWAHGPSPAAIADVLRGCIRAPDGQVLRVADYSNIEGRGLAWLAGEGWKLQAFRDFDAGTGPDLYKVAAAQVFGIEPSEVDKDGRQIGKVLELACGYQGGVGAFESMAAIYGLQIGEHADAIQAALPESVEQAIEAWGAFGKTSGINKRTWVCAEAVKRAWRDKHPATVQFWYDLEHSAMEAVESPGEKIACGPVVWLRKGEWLACRLPSGRALYYPLPQVQTKETPWGSKTDQVTYMAVNSQTRKWSRVSAYGGLWSENITQATARDLLAEAMLRVEAAGREESILTVHDEIIALADPSVGSQAEFEARMAETPSWAQCLPIAVEGYEAQRYRKD
jgi:DNA polymerase